MRLPRNACIRVLHPDPIIVVYNQNMAVIEHLNPFRLVGELERGAILEPHRLWPTRLIALQRQNPQKPTQRIAAFKARCSIESVLVVAIELNRGNP
ncbi:hypothetical protein D3C77_665830 [compost metagenome]